MIPIPFGFLGSQAGAAPTFLLDTYPGATIAFSVRLLRAAYTGNCFKVRRAADGVELDIGFTAAGDLDAGSLTSFANGGSCTVTTWYDQSGGGYDITNTTVSQQPQITDASGQLILAPTRAALEFQNTSGGAAYLNFATPFQAYGASSSFFLAASAGRQGSKYMWGGSGPGSKPAYLTQYAASFEWYDQDRIVIANGVPTVNVSQVSTTITMGGTVTAFFDGSQVFSQTAGTNTGTRNIEVVGGSGPGIDISQANWSEFIIYGTTNQSANQLAIATDVNAYF